MHVVHIRQDILYASCRGKVWRRKKTIAYTKQNSLHPIFKNTKELPSAAWGFLSVKFPKSMQDLSCFHFWKLCQTYLTSSKCYHHAQLFAMQSLGFRGDVRRKWGTRFGSLKVTSSMLTLQTRSKPVKWCCLSPSGLIVSLDSAEIWLNVWSCKIWSMCWIYLC